MRARELLWVLTRTVISRRWRRFTVGFWVPTRLHWAYAPPTYRQSYGPSILRWWRFVSTFSFCFCEEPRLRKVFGEHICMIAGGVRRWSWIPRFRPMP